MHIAGSTYYCTKHDFHSKIGAYIHAKSPILACVLHSTIDHQNATDFVESTFVGIALLSHFFISHRHT